MTLPARAPNLLMIARPKPRKGLAIAKLRIMPLGKVNQVPKLQIYQVEWKV